MDFQLTGAKNLVSSAKSVRSLNGNLKLQADNGSRMIALAVYSGWGLSWWRYLHSVAEPLLVAFFLAMIFVRYLMKPTLWLFFYIVSRFWKTEDKGQPCPVRGYDIRATLDRCPECGTELMWGELPDNPSDQSARKRFLQVRESKKELLPPP